MARSEKQATEFKLKVSTCYRYTHPDEVEQGAMKGIGKPQVPVLVRSGDGVRVLFGTHDPKDEDAPVLLVERQANGWLIVLQPEGTFGDPSGYVYFLDGGKSYLMRDDLTSIIVLPSGNESPYRMHPVEDDD